MVANPKREKGRKRIKNESCDSLIPLIGINSLRNKIFLNKWKVISLFDTMHQYYVTVLRNLGIMETRCPRVFC